MPSPNQLIDRPSECGLNEVGQKGSGTGTLEVVECGAGMYRQTVFRFRDFKVQIADNSTTGSGNAKIYTFPQGVIDIVGATGQLDLDYSVTTDANLVASLGTAQAGADGTLTSTEANVAPSASAAIAQNRGVATFKTSSRVGLIDGSSAALGLFLNFATSSDPAGTQTLTINGNLVVSWGNIGYGQGLGQGDVPGGGLEG